jgi:hypothetical protein
MNVFGGPGATTSSDWWTNLNSVSDTIAAGTAYGVQCHTRQPAGADMSVVHTGMRTRIAVTTTTRVYLNGQSTYSGSSYSSSGSLQATLVN